MIYMHEVIPEKSGNQVACVSKIQLIASE